MKTALTKLIEKWESEMGSYMPNIPIYSAFIEDAKKLVEWERMTIQDAFDDGQANWDEKCRDVEDGKQYYSENFKS